MDISEAIALLTGMVYLALTIVRLVREARRRSGERNGR